MRRFTSAFLHSRILPKRSLPSSFSFNSLASSPEAAEVGAQASSPEAAEVGACTPNICIGALETRNTILRKALKLKAEKIGYGSVHADNSASIVEISRLNIKSRKAKTNIPGAKAGAEFAESQDAHVHENAATQEANVSVFHEKSVLETGNIFPNEAVERSGEIEVKAAEGASNGMVRAKEEFLSEWAANLDLKSFKNGRKWMETAYKLLNYGIPSAYVKSMLQKCRMLPCGCQAESTLENFAMLGMTHEEMGSMISRWPTILNSSDNSFRSRVEFFESVGVDKRALGKIMHRAYWVMTVSCSVLRRRYEFWDDYFQDVGKNAFRTIVLRDPKILACNLQTTVKPNLAHLEALGLSVDKKLLLKSPTVLSNSVKAFALKLKVLEHFGASDARSLTIAFAKLQVWSIVTLQERLHNLFMLGFSFDHVKIIMTICPEVLAYMEDRINLRVNYAVSVLKISLDVLAGCPLFWNSSFERRIKYRYEVLQKLRALGISAKDYRLTYILTLSEADFSTKFLRKLHG